ncbi:hypothetical protein PFISCL1PPCAC_4172, partial [Pristionchus fissidentatus]
LLIGQNRNNDERHSCINGLRRTPLATMSDECGEARVMQHIPLRHPRRFDQVRNSRGYLVLWLL